jgi:hypothetical protein
MPFSTDPAERICVAAGDKATIAAVSRRASG